MPRSAEPIVVKLRAPYAALQRRAAYTLVIGGVLLFASTFVDHASASEHVSLSLSVLALQALGVAIVSFAVFLFVAARRVGAWKEFALRIDEEAIEIPVRPLSRRETQKVPLEEIELVSYAASGAGPRLEVLARTGLYLLPFGWFPKDVSPTDLALRLHVRSQLARARQRLEPAELAAIEATMLAGKSFGAFVVERLDGPPEVLATLDAATEKDDVAERLKGKGAKLYDCAERIRALREALERGLAAPLLPAAMTKAE